MTDEVHEWSRCPDCGGRIHRDEASAAGGLCAACSRSAAQSRAGESRALSDDVPAGAVFVADVERLGAGRYGERTWISRRLLFRASTREHARRRVEEEADGWHLVRLKRANARERRVAEERDL